MRYSAPVQRIDLEGEIRISSRLQDIGVIANFGAKRDGLVS